MLGPIPQIGIPSFTVDEGLVKIQNHSHFTMLNSLLGPEIQNFERQCNGGELGVGGLREKSERIPFLHVQQTLRQSWCHGAGLNRSHYSASKLFQCFVTAPRVFGFLHEESEANQILTNVMPTISCPVR